MRAWTYESSIGPLFIVPLENHRFGFVYDGTLWEACHTPEAEADNIYMHVTGCFEWDSLDGVEDSPSDLREWESIEM